MASKKQSQLQKVKADFRVCLYLVWKHLRLPDPTPIQYEIADFLQNRGEDRKLIMAFRGVGKSWITSAYVLWCLLNDTEGRFLVVSASKDRADAFAVFTKRLIDEMPLFRRLKPNPDKKQRDSMLAFDVGPSRAAHAPSVKSAGINGQITGSRATEIIADDVEIPKNSATQDLREKLEERTKEFSAIIVPGGRITFLGTPQSEESIYTRMDTRGYAIRIWPGRIPEKSKLGIYKGKLAQSIMARVEAGDYGKPTDPDRFDELDLMKREGDYGRSGFALQFMLDTSLSDAERYPLKCSDLIVMDIHNDVAPITIGYSALTDYLIKDIPNPGFTGDRWYKPMFVDKEWAPYEGTVMAIDPSGRGKDETGYAVVKHLHGYLWVLDVGGFKGGYEDETLKKLAMKAKECGVKHIIIEANFGDGMFTQLFQPVLRQVYPHCSVEEVKHNIQKEKRIIDTLEPVMNRHKLVVDREAIVEDLKVINDTERGPQYSLFYQMTRLTKDRGALKHDDRLDALAIAVAYWVEYMARDEQTAAKDYRDKLLDDELEKFMNGVLHVGVPPPRAPNWMNRITH